MVTAKGISDGERRRRCRSGAFGASERSGLDLLEGEGDGGAARHAGEVAAAASAMVEEGEGEVQGTNGGVQGLGGATWRSSSSSTGEAASRWRRGELAHAGVTSVPALAGASS